MVPGPGCPLRGPKWGRTPGTEMEKNGNGNGKKMNVLFFVFMAFWHPDRNGKKERNISRTN